MPEYCELHLCPQHGAAEPGAGQPAGGRGLGGQPPCHTLPPGALMVFIFKCFFHLISVNKFLLVHVIRNEKQILGS